MDHRKSGSIVRTFRRGGARVAALGAAFVLVLAFTAPAGAASASAAGSAAGSASGSAVAPAA
ncbi:MAG: hypothetical protein HOW97_24310, partial [Catenulispora sp.]|nr:hypothetical protein [Catenulispora sp.]